jgi:alkaline phosphatase
MKHTSLLTRFRAFGAAPAAIAVASLFSSTVATQAQPKPRKKVAHKLADQGGAVLRKLKFPPVNNRPARNVILFVGDGMGVSTVTAARILEGQLRGETGEENQLSFDKFPWTAYSKTYSVNQQVSDSAPTMTAMVTGVKTEDGILSVDQDVVRGDYSTVAGNELVTILEQAEKRGLSTGVVSTARVTHATPAACYAHSPERDWEDDSKLPADAKAADFPDIARQLLEFPYGNGLEVVLGGGRQHFLPKPASGSPSNDPEDAGKSGSRLDGRDLTTEWTTKYPNSAFIWNQAQFDAIDPATTKHLLGLFERSHMEYEADRANDTGKEPSLTDMTKKAVQILSKNKRGYFLMVEGGRIDHAHHAGNAYRALTDTIEMAQAVKAAREMTGEDTLIVVTADHSHVFTMAGYPARGNDILGVVREPGDDGIPSAEPSLDMLGLPYTTLGYANGPGYTGASNQQPEGLKVYPHFPSTYAGITSGRPTIDDADTDSINFMQEATVPLSSETHAGEDVGIYADGPNAHLFHGTLEQNMIYHIMADALKF